MVPFLSCSDEHTCFSYNIDSITLYATKKHDGKGSRPVSVWEYMKALEVVLRGMSNIEEKLHQSFYFYLLPNDRNFVSIGEYYYALGLIVLPCFVQLLRLLSSTASLRMAFGLVSGILAVGLGALALLATHYPMPIFQWMGLVNGMEVLGLSIILFVFHDNALLKGSRSIYVLNLSTS